MGSTNPSDAPVNVFVCGGNGSGKSSVINRLISNTFNEAYTPVEDDDYPEMNGSNAIELNHQSGLLFRFHESRFPCTFEIISQIFGATSDDTPVDGKLKDGTKIDLIILVKNISSGEGNLGPCQMIPRLLCIPKVYPGVPIIILNNKRDLCRDEDLHINTSLMFNVDTILISNRVVCAKNGLGFNGILESYIEYINGNNQ